MPRNLLSLLAIIILTILFVVLWDSPPEGLRRLVGARETPAAYPQSYLTDVETIQFNADGEMDYSVQAARVSYYQFNPHRKTIRDYTLIDTPNITMFDADNPPWQVSAEHGRTSDEGTMIKLWGNVKIWRTDQKGNTSELSTSQLVIKPKAQYAETDKPVMINTANGKAQAIGMKAFLKQQRIQLLSNVRGVHEAI